LVDKENNKYFYFQFVYCSTRLYIRYDLCVNTGPADRMIPYQIGPILTPNLISSHPSPLVDSRVCTPLYLTENVPALFQHRIGRLQNKFLSSLGKDLFLILLVSPSIWFLVLITNPVIFLSTAVPKGQTSQRVVSTLIFIQDCPCQVLLYAMLMHVCVILCSNTICGYIISPFAYNITLTDIHCKVGTFNSTGQKHCGHYSIWTTNTLQERLLYLCNHFTNL